MTAGWEFDTKGKATWLKVLKNNIKISSNTEVCLSIAKKWLDKITKLWSTSEHLNKHFFLTKNITTWDRIQSVGHNWKPGTPSCRIRSSVLAPNEMSHLTEM